MSALPSDANITNYYSNVLQEDLPTLAQWLQLQTIIEDINKLPPSKTAKRRNRATFAWKETVKFGSLFIKYPFLVSDYFSCMRIIIQHLNAQSKPLEERAKEYFQELYPTLGRTIIDNSIEFDIKNGGDQLGSIMRLKYVDYESQEEHLIQYYIKTHHGGSKGGQSRENPVDPKELFIYKVLEFIGLGPKVYFFFNQLSNATFYIATQDVGFSRSNEKQKTKQFMTIQDFKEKLLSLDSDIHKFDDMILYSLAISDILSRIFSLQDILTNLNNSGFVINIHKVKYKIIDFVVDTRINYYCDRIYDGYLSGNGMYHYLGDTFLNKYLKDISMLEKANIAKGAIQKYFFRTKDKLSLSDAIENASMYVLQYVNDNKQYLGIEINQDDPQHDFNRYVTCAKLTLNKFLQDMNDKSLDFIIRPPSEIDAESVQSGNNQSL